jgi:dipeptidyl aminopeptidase/acylaminoacyl peptidase
MRCRSRLLRRLLVVAIASAPVQSVVAQSTTPPTATKASGLRALNLEDYGRWNRITNSAISSDGRWVTFTYSPNEGEPVLHAKAIDGDKTYTVSLGAAPGRGGGGGGRGGGGGNAPQFSEDGKWLTYFVNPPDRTAGRGRGGPPAPGGRGAAQGGAPAAPGHLELLNLATGDKVSISNVGSWRFSADSRWLAARLNRAQAEARHQGADLILRELSTGLVRNIGNVNQYEFNDAGRLFAYTVDAVDRLGNGVYLLDLATSETRVLSSGTADYDGMVWSSDGLNLAVLRGDKAREQKQKDNTLLAWSGLGSPAAKPLVFDPAKDAAFPKNMVVSEFSAPRWSKDGSRVFIGIKEQEREVPAADSTKANVDVWHWKDVTPQSVQIVQLTQLRRATHPAVVFLNTGKFVRLGDDEMRTVQTAANGTVGVGRNDAAYRGEVAWGGSRADLYKVDVATGARTLIEKALSRTYGTSPDSKWFLYLKDKHIRAFNLVTGSVVELDAATPGKSFVNEDDDHAYEKPIWGVGGWAKDGRSVLLYDKFDVWQLPLDGGKAVNLTNGVGAAQEIRFRVTRFGGPGQGGRGGGGGRGAGPAAEDDEGIDLTKPVLLSAFGERTKKSGYWQVVAGKQPEPIVFVDKNIGGVQKAEKADRIVFTQQTFNEFPDIWTSNQTFAAPKKLTDANPFFSEHLWSPQKVLVDYTNSKGQRLQGTLMLPAGYEPGKRYPMLVEFYELMSNTHHNFSVPGYSNSPQLSTYASNGYLVLQPDVVYEIGKPGTSAVDCVTAAVKKVIEMGYADPKRIGLHGHSWSGYQSSYIVTQTDMFAAVVTGAPPTNLISFYNELYKSSGTVQQGITEVGQVRMGADVTPWNNHDLYEEQSPIFHVRNIKTPFMILHGMEDGAVDYVEGLQFFNAARRNGKQVILLAYPGEAHNLTNRDNQKDFSIRMKQYFDHYLMDKPAPKWLSDGLPQVQKGLAPR